MNVLLFWKASGHHSQMNGIGLQAISPILCISVPRTGKAQSSGDFLLKAKLIPRKTQCRVLTAKAAGAWLTNGRMTIMKIKVQRCDGQIETLTLVPPIEVHDTRVNCGDGTDHFFTEDGLYDGWGRAVSVNEPAAEQIIKNVEESRDVAGERPTEG